MTGWEYTWLIPIIIISLIIIIAFITLIVISIKQDHKKRKLLKEMAKQIKIRENKGENKNE